MERTLQRLRRDDLRQHQRPREFVSHDPSVPEQLFPDAAEMEDDLALPEQAQLVSTDSLDCTRVIA